uniref:Uncharacterized protein n=1 Tax=Candidatus Kentrum sp. FW TaxID=2126338 RepID=A0A450RXL3_9GAMM|nr:MAG: hypothetical protein BECKFW1821A_GA0114235_100553 [Candidatus Kentron sp. FW]
MILLNRLKSVESLDDLNDVKELGDSILRKEKRRALLTLLAIAEEIDNEEIMESIEKLSGYEIEIRDHYFLERGRQRLRRRGTRATRLHGRRQNLSGSPFQCRENYSGVDRNGNGTRADDPRTSGPPGICLNADA